MSDLNAPFTVSFDRCEAGWITLNLAADGHTLDLRASHLHDPLPDMLAWLEALSLGLPRCGWTLDEEWALVTFDVVDAMPAESLTKRPTALRLTVTPDYNEPPLTCTLARRALVQTFYQALREFVTSDRYRPGEWERQSLGDRLREKTGQDPAAWVEALLATPLSRRELQKRFWRIHGGTISGVRHDPELMGTAEEYIEMTGGSVPLIQGSFPLYWLLEEWETLPDTAARRAYLQACLDDDEDSSWSGLPWPRMRSAHIENWLIRNERLSPPDWTRWLITRVPELGRGSESSP